MEQEQQEMAVVVADWVVVVVVDDDSTLANAADQFAPLAGPRSEMEIPNLPFHVEIEGTY